jgi:hypothetical protein
MLNHPALLEEIAAQHNKNLIDSASKYRLAAATSRHRRQRWPDSPSSASERNGGAAGGRTDDRRTVGTLASCEIAGQAR